MKSSMIVPFILTLMIGIPIGYYISEYVNPRFSPCIKNYSIMEVWHSRFSTEYLDSIVLNPREEILEIKGVKYFVPTYCTLAYIEHNITPVLMRK